MGNPAAQRCVLYGPPGTGKTLLAKALAGEADAAFLHVRVTNVVTKWYADSVDVLQEVFAQVKECGRCILFLDEIDDLVFERAAPEELRIASRRLVNSVGEHLDDLGQPGDVLAVASTNRPERRGSHPDSPRAHRPHDRGSPP